MRRVLPILLMLFSLTLVGAVGFRLLSGSSWVDCTYMAVITLTTVGYREAVPLDDAGKMFVIVYLMLGIGTFTYSAFYLGQLIVGLRVSPVWERRRMKKEIGRISNHFIVCGYGRMGHAMCDYLSARGKQFVVIDRDPDHIRTACEEHNWPHIVGDATDDEILIAAGIKQARSLASALHSDADNVYVVLSARLLNPQIQIISRASDEAAVVKIQRAGADRVISPFSTAGVKMARMMLHPSIEDFLEIADARGNDLEVAEIQISEANRYAGKKLHETDLSDKGVMVIGIRRVDGEQLMPPPGSAILHSGDRLFVFGTAVAVNAMVSQS